MKNILLVYGTSYGHTERIARRLADRLGAHGFAMTVCRGDEPAARQPLDDFDALVVGGSIIGGKHQRYIVDFVERNLVWLNSHASAFFSVSGNAASSFPQQRAEARAVLEKFLQATGWLPLRATTFGGMIAYTRYNFLLRWIMKLLAKRGGGPTDTSRDHDMTDWAAVDRFADELTGMLTGAEPPKPVPVA